MSHKGRVKSPQALDLNGEIGQLSKPANRGFGIIPEPLLSCGDVAQLVRARHS